MGDWVVLGYASFTHNTCYDIAFIFIFWVLYPNLCEPKEWRFNNCHVRSQICLAIVKISSRVCFLGTCHICWVAHCCGFCYEVDFSFRDLWDYLETPMWLSYKDPYNKVDCLHLLWHKEGACIFLLYLSHPCHHIIFLNKRIFLLYLSLSWSCHHAVFVFFLKNNVHLSLFFSFMTSLHAYSYMFILLVSRFLVSIFFLLFFTSFMYIFLIVVGHWNLVSCACKYGIKSSHYVSKKAYLC